MSTKAFRAFLTSAALAVATVGVVGDVGAIVYRGDFDPSFGSPYPSLGYRGVGFFEVDSGCLATTGWKVSGDPCGPMALLSATVDLYQHPPSADPPPTLQSLTFANYAPPGNPDPIIGIYVAFNSFTGQNEVMGVDTFLLGEQIANAPALAGIYQGPLWLEFVSGFAVPNFFFDAVDAVNVTEGAYLWAGTCDKDCIRGPRSVEAAAITFTRVPEPGSLALIVGALGAGWLSRRRLVSN